VNCLQNCGARAIAREEIPSHIEKDCPLTIIACPHDQIGCTAKVQRKEIESHLQSATKSHLDLACVKLNNTQIQLSTTQTQLGETQIQLNVTQQELKETKIRLEEKVNSLENKLMQIPRVPHTWKITGYSQVMKQAKSGEVTEIKSAPFYDHGYKFRLSLDANGHGTGKDTHLSIFFHLMKGEYDAILPWPFCKKMTFTLVDQQEDLNDRENFAVTFTADKEKCKRSFKRPVEEENSGWGFPKFVSHNKLQERRYIVDDTIFIQVEVALPRC